MMQGITTDKDHTIPTLIPTVKQQGKVSCDVNSCLLFDVQTDCVYSHSKLSWVQTDFSFRFQSSGPTVTWTVPLTVTVQCL